MTSRSNVKSIDEYIAGFPAAAREKLDQMRGLIRAAAPEANETISYRMPTFDLNGKHLVFFAGFAKHIGLYALPRAMDAFADELKSYKTGRGSIQFPLDLPLPADLITRMVKFRVRELA